jgi:hypothetical protein
VGFVGVGNFVLVNVSEHFESSTLAGSALEEGFGCECAHVKFIKC